jgi:hypothetical protein
MTDSAPLPDWSSLLAERDATIERLQAESKSWQDAYNRSALQLKKSAGWYAEAEAKVRRLRAALDAWMDAVHIDATMEGAQYMGVSRTLGRIAWTKTLAVLKETSDD